MPPEPSGARARTRLQESEYYDDLMLLSELDRRGRVRGAPVCELDEAIEFLRACRHRAVTTTLLTECTDR